MYVNALYEAYSSPGLAGLRQWQSTYMCPSSSSSVFCSGDPDALTHDSCRWLNTLPKEARALDALVVSQADTNRCFSRNNNCNISRDDDDGILYDKDAKEMVRVNSDVGKPTVRTHAQGQDSSTGAPHVENLFLLSVLHNSVSTAHRIRALLMQLDEPHTAVCAHDPDQTPFHEAKLDRKDGDNTVRVGLRLLSAVEDLRQSLNALSENLICEAGNHVSSPSQAKLCSFSELLLTASPVSEEHSACTPLITSLGADASTHAQKNGKTRLSSSMVWSALPVCKEPINQEEEDEDEKAYKQAKDEVHVQTVRSSLCHKPAIQPVDLVHEDSQPTVFVETPARVSETQISLNIPATANIPIVLFSKNAGVSSDELVTCARDDMADDFDKQTCTDSCLVQSLAPSLDKSDHKGNAEESNAFKHVDAQDDTNSKHTHSDSRSPADASQRSAGLAKSPSLYSLEGHESHKNQSSEETQDAKRSAAVTPHAAAPELTRTCTAASRAVADMSIAAMNQARLEGRYGCDSVATRAKELSKCTFRLDDNTTRYVTATFARSDTSGSDCHASLVQTAAGSQADDDDDGTTTATTATASSDHAAHYTGAANIFDDLDNIDTAVLCDVKPLSLHKSSVEVTIRHSDCVDDSQNNRVAAEAIQYEHRVPDALSQTINTSSIRNVCVFDKTAPVLLSPSSPRSDQSHAYSTNEYLLEQCRACTGRCRKRSDSIACPYNQESEVVERETISAYFSSCVKMCNTYHKSHKK